MYYSKYTNIKYDFKIPSNALWATASIAFKPDVDVYESFDPDKDGIKGAYDECPNDAENYIGFKDTDGCPDELQDQSGNGINQQPDDPKNQNDVEALNNAKILWHFIVDYSDGSRQDVYDKSGDIELVKQSLLGGGDLLNKSIKKLTVKPYLSLIHI